MRRSRRIGLIGAPSSAGAYAPGQEKAPGALRAAGLVARLEETGLTVADRGDVPGLRWRPDRERRFAQNLEHVVAIARAVAERVADVLAGDGLALVLGGDCTVGIGTVAGAVAGGERIGLLYFDLHADLNVPASTPDGALDWMGVAHMLGEEGAEPSPVDVGPRTPLLAPEQILLYGFRRDQSTRAERAAIERRRIDVVEYDEVVVSPAASARSALERLSARCERLLVHFDVDVIDFTDAPLSENTGRNVGLTRDQAFEALAVFLASDRLCALTITELNPDHGEPDGGTIDDFVGRLCAAMRSAYPPAP